MASTKETVRKPPKAKPPVAAPAVVKRTRKARPVLTPEQKRCYIEVAAYYIAERRGFAGGSTLDDWVQAEVEIDRLLREGILKP